MSTLYKTFLLVFVFLWTVNAKCTETLPPAIKGFCDLAFAGDIAGKGQKFNASDVTEKGVPQRRILGYFVGEHYAYLWYEHGGKSYHQHLVKFSKTPPYELKASYVFNSTQHKDIHNLIKDKRFLNSHLINQCGL